MDHPRFVGGGGDIAYADHPGGKDAIVDNRPDEEGRSGANAHEPAGADHGDV